MEARQGHRVNAPQLGYTAALLEQARRAEPRVRRITHGACERRAGVFDGLVPWPALAASWRDTAQLIEEMGLE